MIDRQAVISLACGLYGMEAEGLAALCDAACLEVEAQMKKNADPSDSRIIALAAAMLFYRFVIRSAGADEALRLVTPVVFSLEEAIEFIADDELIEVTPKSIRLRKRILNTELRLKAQSKLKKEQA